MKEFEVLAVSIRRKDQMSATKLVVGSLKPSLFCLLTESKGAEVIWRVYWGYINEVSILGNRIAKNQWLYRWPRKGDKRDGKWCYKISGNK